ncbi:MAG: hypothetical protein CMO80_19420 [Verrucomicrobiales bacterium]|nr:hypothetical protein [Verrucomicrobiales bacterium]|tara:strand:+ start:5941 stop:6318 length:378 start_codon:yes stop_codon:yes gene_type:complete
MKQAQNSITSDHMGALTLTAFVRRGNLFAFHPLVRICLERFRTVHTEPVDERRNSQRKERQHREISQMGGNGHRGTISPDQRTEEPLHDTRQQHHQRGHSSNGIQRFGFFLLNHVSTETAGLSGG